MRSLMSNAPPIGSPAPRIRTCPAVEDERSITWRRCQGWGADSARLRELDPWLKDNTRVVEKRYKELWRKITVLVTRARVTSGVAQGSEAVVDFILSNQR